MLFELRLAQRLSHSPPIDDLLALRQRLRMAIDQKMPLRLQELAVNGDDLQHLGITPGPRLEKILQTLLSHVLDDQPRTHACVCLALHGLSEICHNTVGRARGGITRAGSTRLLRCSEGLGPEAVSLRWRPRPLRQTATQSAAFPRAHAPPPHRPAASHPCHFPRLGTAVAVVLTR